jgi:G3E family GTPase
LNYLITENHGKKYAIILNEFGETVGEGKFLFEKKGEAGPEWMELPNGCVCCTVRTELVQALEKLVKSKDKFEHVFIETTGLADPGPLAASLWVDDELESDIYLDSIITVVDGKNFERELTSEAGFEARRQIAFADRVLLNKCDLLTREDIARIRQTINEINPAATILESVRSRVPLDLITSVGAFSFDRLTEVDPQLAKALEAEEHHHEHKHESHTAREVNAVAFEVHGEVISEEVVAAWLGEWSWTQDEQSTNGTVWRAKARLAVKGHESPCLAQAVHAALDVRPTSLPWGDVPRVNRWAMTGVNLDRDKLVKSFTEQCIVK